MRMSDGSSDECSAYLLENAAENPARVARRHQPVDGADGERLIGDRKIGPDADKGGSRRIRPEWLSALGGHEQHRGDLLQLDHNLVRIGAVDVAERIITGGSALRIGRIEQVNGLAVFLAKTRRGFTILTIGRDA